MFVLLFSSFDTFHAQGKMRMVFRTFAILTLPCYLILDNKILGLAGKDMFQRGVNHDTIFDVPVACCYDLVLGNSTL